MNQDKNCKCCCCQDALIGCLCLYSPKEQRCDCNFCKEMIRDFYVHAIPHALYDDADIPCCGIFNEVIDGHIVCNECRMFLDDLNMEKICL